jgi:beta-glucosidase-like glycosyl hydrolase
VSRPTSDSEKYSQVEHDTEERVRLLLGQMTLEEKAAQTAAPFSLMNDLSSPPTTGWGCGGAALSVLNLPPRETAEAGNELQRKHVEDTRLGIPIIMAEECLVGLKVRSGPIFPDAIAQAATWDPDLITEMAQTIGRHMALLGVRQALSPLADVARDPRWGRVEETYGEDPYLVGSMATAFVSGLQSAVPDMPVIATLKHFVAYSASEGGRNCEPAHLGDRALREVYALPFEMAIRLGGARGVMVSLNAVDGIPVQGSRALLTDLLRGELGFNGVIISDLSSVIGLHSRHATAADAQDAIVQSVRAGTDLDLYATASTDDLVDAVRTGRLDETELDRATGEVLRAKVRMGLFERPYVDVQAVPTTLDGADERSLARRIAERAIILLQNRPVDGTPLLPFNTEIRSIAVIGPNADRPMGYLGNYSYPILDSGAQVFRQVVTQQRPNEDPDYANLRIGPDDARMLVDSVHIVTALEGIRRRAGSDVTVRYERGCPIATPDRSGFDAAISAAIEADVAVLVLGDQSGIAMLGTVGEHIDSVRCALPGVQRDLVEAVVATGTPTVAVLSHGRAFVLGWMANAVPAIVSSFFGGEEAGNAIADVLFGDVNPGGRTPVSFLRSIGAAPAPYPRTAEPDNSYFDGSAGAVFPFGHGLSYTTFEYRNLEIESDEVATDGVARISCTVVNTGDRSGDEVVQLYGHDVIARTVRPSRQLIGFHRLRLGAGEGAHITFEVPASMFALWDAGEWVVEPGMIELSIASSSAAMHLTSTVRLTGNEHYPGPDRALTTLATLAPAQ